jgi:quinol monooxygenase YgiN
MTGSLHMHRYSYIWEFQVRPDRQATFERIYGPDGDWAALFRQSAGYVGTLLLKDSAVANRYVTIDRWESKEAYELFVERFGQEYRTLDAKCEALTVDEKSLGTYTE